MLGESTAPRAGQKQVAARPASALSQVHIFHVDVIPRADDFCRPEESASATTKSRFLARARNDSPWEEERIKWDGTPEPARHSATAIPSRGPSFLQPRAGIEHQSL